MKILILRNTVTRIDAHCVLLANAFLARGDEVYFGLINAVATHDYHVYGPIAPYRVELEYYAPIAEPVKWESLENFDLVWIMKAPHPHLAKDVWQILWLLSKRVPFVNSIEALLFLETKNTLGYLVPQEHLVENHVTNCFDVLWNIQDNQPQERWILKPTNGSSGADVFLVDAQGSNNRALLQSMTGNTKPATDPTVTDNLSGLQNKYAVLQKFAPEVQHGEKRVIIAGGEIIVVHGRSPTDGEHRSNLANGGQPYETNLTPQELQMCSQLAQRLLDNGVGYIGLDISYPYVLEFNLIEPGGLYRMLVLTGKNYTPRAIECIMASRIVTHGAP